MRTLFKDIRYCRRMLIQSFTVTVIAALAAPVGFGANTNPDVVCPSNHSNQTSRNHVFGDIAADVDRARVSLTGAGAPEELFAGEVTADFFSDDRCTTRAWAQLFEGRNPPGQQSRCHSES